MVRNGGVFHPLRHHAPALDRQVIRPIRHTLAQPRQQSGKQRYRAEILRLLRSLPV